MGTRLRGDRHAFAACPVHLRQSVGTADVDDVRAHTLAGAAHADEQSADRVDLGGSRPGVAPGKRIRRALGGEHLLALGVYTYDRVQASSHLEPNREHAVGHARKVVDAAVTHEGLEADDAALVEGFEVSEVFGDQTSP